MTRRRWLPYYYVASPPKDGRQNYRWVLGQRNDLGLADWSYGHNCHSTIRKAKAQARKAKKLWPNRRFVIRLTRDGNAYQNIQEI